MTVVGKWLKKLTLENYRNGTDDYDEKSLDDKSRTDDDYKEYILGYSPVKLKKEEGSYLDEFAGMKINDYHCVYVQRRYRRIPTNRKGQNDVPVYQCINSWGFFDPFPIIQIDSKAIVRMWLVTIKADKADKTKNH